MFSAVLIWASGVLGGIWPSGPRATDPTQIHTAHDGFLLSVAVCAFCIAAAYLEISAAGGPPIAIGSVYVPFLSGTGEKSRADGQSPC